MALVNMNTVCHGIAEYAIARAYDIDEDNPPHAHDTDSMAGLAALFATMADIAVAVYEKSEEAPDLDPAEIIENLGGSINLDEPLRNTPYFPPELLELYAGCLKATDVRMRNG